jgi:hypothetical protein
MKAAGRLSVIDFFGMLSGLDAGAFQPTAYNMMMLDHSAFSRVLEISEAA